MSWWSASQPEWRNTGEWPFEQEDAVGHQWGDLPDGGKDGIFLILVSLGWWVLAQGSSQDPRVGEAITDVAWVVNNLVSLLAVEATAPDSPSPPSPPRKKCLKRSDPPKVGPSRGRSKRARA